VRVIGWQTDSKRSRHHPGKNAATKRHEVVEATNGLTDRQGVEDISTITSIHHQDDRSLPEQQGNQHALKHLGPPLPRKMPIA